MAIADAVLSPLAQWLGGILWLTLWSHVASGQSLGLSYFGHMWPHPENERWSNFLLFTSQQWFLKKKPKRLGKSVFQIQSQAI